MYLEPFSSKKKSLNFPRRALINFDILDLVQKLKIPFFRGVYMRNRLPKKIHRNESGIVNLDNYENDGTHWTAYTKKGNEIIYFNSYGNLRPPIELIDYFLSDSPKNKIKYNYETFQKYNSYKCGHLCLEFLYNMYY